MVSLSGVFLFLFRVVLGGFWVVGWEWFLVKNLSSVG